MLRNSNILGFGLARSRVYQVDSQPSRNIFTFSYKAVDLRLLHLLGIKISLCLEIYKKKKKTVKLAMKLVPAYCVPSKKKKKKTKMYKNSLFIKESI